MGGIRKTLLKLLGHFPNDEVHSTVHRLETAGVDPFTIFTTLLQFLNNPNVKLVVAALLKLLPLVMTNEAPAPAKASKAPHRKRS